MITDRITTTQPLGDKTAMTRAANIFWKTCIREKITPEEMRSKGVVPRPETVDDFVLACEDGFFKVETHPA